MKSTKTHMESLTLKEEFRHLRMSLKKRWKSGKWHDVTWYEKALLPYEDVPAEMIPIGKMEKETVDKILASF